MPEVSYTAQILLTAEDKASAALKKVSKTTQETSSAFKQSATGLKKFNDSLTSLRTGLAAIGAVALYKTVREIYNLGTESIRSEIALTGLAGGAEQAGKALDALEQATGGEIDRMTLARLATRMYTTGIAENTDELVRFMKTAEALGDVMGMSAAQAIEALSNALITRSPRALRSLGIDAEGVARNVAKLQHSSQGLSQAQIYTEAVLAESSNTLSKFSGSAFEAVDASDRMSAAWTNLKAEAGRSLAPFLSQAMDSATLLLTWNKKLKQIADERRDWALTDAKDYDEYIRQMEAILKVTDKNTYAGYDYMKSVRGQAFAVSELALAQKVLTRQAWETQRRYQKLSVEVDTWLNHVPTVAEEAARLGRSFGETIDPIYRASEAVRDMTGAFDNFDISQEAVWKLMMATGRFSNLTAKQIGVLAVQMGVADGSAVQQSIKMYELVEAYDAGILSARDLSIATQELRTGTMTSTLDVARAQGQVIIGSDAARLRYDDMKSSVEETEEAVEGIPTEVPIDIHVTDADSLMSYLLTIRRVIGEIEGNHNVNLGMGSGQPTYMPSNAPYYNPAVATPAEAGTQTTSERGPVTGGANPYGGPAQQQNFNLTVNTTRDLFSVRHEFNVMSALGGQ